jgi:hypothetical protein
MIEPIRIRLTPWARAELQDADAPAEIVLRTAGVLMFGEKGAQGDPGRDGDPGPPGPPGTPADGATDPGDLTLIFDNGLI